MYPPPAGAVSKPAASRHVVALSAARMSWCADRQITGKHVVVAALGIDSEGFIGLTEHSAVLFVGDLETAILGLFADCRAG
jgi:hypothetical protein